jgi:hypothetical protein
MEMSDASGGRAPWPAVGWRVVFLAVALAAVGYSAEPVVAPAVLDPAAPAVLDPAAAAGLAGAAVAPPVVETLADGAVRLGGITVEPRTRSVSFAATLNDRLIDVILEVIIATPRGRLHEALLCADISPLTLQSCLYLLKLNNGPRLTDSTGRRGDLLDIDLEYTAADGKAVREPVESWIRDMRAGKTLQRSGWVFTGSSMREGVFLAEAEGNLCINFSVGSTILDSPDPQAVDDTIHVIESSRTEPKPGAQVRVIITARGKTP